MPQLRFRALALGLGLLVLAALVAAFWVHAADPFCWRGYVTEDGSCAWE